VDPGAAGVGIGVPGGWTGGNGGTGGSVLPPSTMSILITRLAVRGTALRLSWRAR
jgi:hypothetical protein